MPKLYLVGITEDRSGLVLAKSARAKKGDSVLEVDHVVLDALAEIRRYRSEGTTKPTISSPALPSRKATAGEVSTPSALSPREIQSRLRRGESIQSVARRAGVEEWRIEVYAAPIGAEQARVVSKARDLSMVKRGAGQSGRPLGESVQANVIEKRASMNADEFESAWTAYEPEPDRWIVVFEYASRGTRQRAEWMYEEDEENVVAINRLATTLGWRDPRRTGKLAPLLDAPRMAATKKPARRKTAARKAATRRPAARKAATRRPSARKAATRRPSARKPASRKPPAPKRSTKKRPAAKSSTKKRAASRAPAKKASAKRPVAKKSVGQQGEAASGRGTTSAARTGSAKKSTAKKTRPAKSTARKPAKASAAKRTVKPAARTNRSPGAAGSAAPASRSRRQLRIVEPPPDVEGDERGAARGAEAETIGPRRSWREQAAIDPAELDLAPPSWLERPPRQPRPAGASIRARRADEGPADEAADARPGTSEGAGRAAPDATRQVPVDTGRGSRRRRSLRRRERPLRSR